MDDRATKAIFVGYAIDHAGDVYRMYDPQTQKIKLSRDVRWLDQMWGADKPVLKPVKNEEDNWEDISIEVKEPELVPEEDPNPNLDYQEGDDLEMEVDPDGNMDAVPGDENGIDESGEEGDEQSSKRRKVERALKKLEWNMAEFAFLSPLERDYTEPANYAQAMKSLDKANWLDAIETEFKRIGERKVWIPIKLADVPEGKKPFGTKWVFKKKDNGVFRARLVALGYNQIPGVDFTDRFSPVVHDMTWRLLLTIFMGQDKDWEQIDVETAFLYGDLEEPVYLKCPEGYSLPPGHVLQLDKALYGLVQAAPSVLQEVCFLVDR